MHFQIFKYVSYFNVQLITLKADKNKNVLRERIELYNIEC